MDLPKYHKIDTSKNISSLHKKKLCSEPRFIVRSKQPKTRKTKQKKTNHKSKHLLPNVKSNKHTLRCVLDAAKSELWRAAKGQNVSKGRVFTEETVLAFLVNSIPDTKNILG